MTRYNNNNNSGFIGPLIVVLFILGALWYEGSVAYRCHQKKGTLVRSYWTELPKCVEAKP